MFGIGGISTVALTVLLVGILIFQGLLVFVQGRRLMNQYKELGKKCHAISIGKRKGSVRTSMCMLGIDEDGRLVEGYLLSGMTVFSKFKRFFGYDGLTWMEIKQRLQTNPTKESACILEAIRQIEQDQMDADFLDDSEEWDAAEELAVGID